MALDVVTAQAALREEQNTRATMEAIIASLCRAMNVGWDGPEPCSLVDRIRRCLVGVYERARALVTDAFRCGVWQTLAVPRAQYPEIDLESLSMGYDAAPHEVRVETD